MALAAVGSARAVVQMTSRFLDPLRVEQVGFVDGRPEWRTLAPVRYQSALLGGTVEIPAETDFDGASVPRWPVTWFVAGGRGNLAALLHDVAYQRQGLVVDGVFRPLTRSEADALFWEALAADPMSGTNAVTRSLMWAAVRVGGWLPWSRHEGRARSLNPEWTASAWPTVSEAP